MKLRDNLTGEVHHLVQRKIDRSELNRLLKFVRQLDPKLGKELEDTIGLWGTELLEKAVATGWWMAKNPEQVVFECDCEPCDLYLGCHKSDCMYSHCR